MHSGLIFSTSAPHSSSLPEGESDRPFPFKGKVRMEMGCLVLAPPFLPPSSADKPGDFGEDCLRPAGPSSAAARLGEQRREPAA